MSEVSEAPDGFPILVGSARSTSAVWSLLRHRGLVVTRRPVRDGYALLLDDRPDNAILCWWDRTTGQVWADTHVPAKRRHGGQRAPRDAGPRAMLRAPLVAALARHGRRLKITTATDDREAALDVVRAHVAELARRGAARPDDLGNSRGDDFPARLVDKSRGKR